MGKIPIAILDRSPSFLHLLVYVLQLRHAAEVEVVAAAHDLKTLFVQASTAPSVVLVGLSVPNLVDPALIHLLREKWPNISVIALIWLESREYDLKALATGVNLVISKTQLDTALLPALRTISLHEYCQSKSDEYAGQQPA